MRLIGNNRSPVNLLCGLIAGGFCSLCVVTIQAADSPEIKFFQDRVEPLLEEKCLGCHSHAAREMEGGLTLDSKSGWETGGDRGPAIIPGKPD